MPVIIMQGKSNDFVLPDDKTYLVWQTICLLYTTTLSGFCSVKNKLIHLTCQTTSFFPLRDKLSPLSYQTLSHEKQVA